MNMPGEILLKVTRLNRSILAVILGPLPTIQSGVGEGVIIGPLIFRLRPMYSLFGIYATPQHL